MAATEEVRRALEELHALTVTFGPTKAALILLGFSADEIDRLGGIDDGHR
jgi:hypothetical protein